MDDDNEDRLILRPVPEPFSFNRGRDTELIRLRKVVEAARIVDRDGLIYSDFEAELLHKALAKLDEITKK